jgi:hypothetical protein
LRVFVEFSAGFIHFRAIFIHFRAIFIHFRAIFVDFGAILAHFPCNSDPANVFYQGMIVAIQGMGPQRLIGLGIIIVNSAEFGRVFNRKMKVLGGNLIGNGEKLVGNGGKMVENGGKMVENG